MDLPNLFSVDMAEAATKLCALIITDSSVQAGLLRVHPSGVELVARSSVVPYTSIKDVQVSADEAFQQLGKESEDVNDVVFVLADTWLDTAANVAPTHRPLIDKLRKDLLLNPVGFVVQQEAICDQVLAKRPQLSGLLLLWEERAISASWINHGVVKISVNVGRSSELKSDLQECLHRLHLADTSRPLPNRIICTSLALPDPALAETQQQLLELEWSLQPDLPELPNIELISPTVCSRLVLEVAGQAMRDVLSQTEGTSASNITHQAVPTTVIDESQSKVEEEVNSDQTQVIDNEPDPNHEAQTASGQDFLDTSETPSGVDGSDDSIIAGDLSMPLNSDSLERAVLPTSFGVPIDEPYETAVLPATSPMPTRSHHPQAPLHTKSSHIPEFSAIRHAKRKHRLKIIVFSCLGVIFALSSVLITMTVARSAEILIIPNQTNVSKEVQLALDSSISESDAATNTLKAREIEATVSDQGETKTTGVKLVGEQAKGEVTLFNKTDAVKSFDKGTLLSNGTLQYSLNDAIEVPAASVSAKPGGAGEEKTYGQKRVGITAVEIGVDGNKPKETVFTVEKYGEDSYTAKAETDISGGSSREIQVVSQADIDVLLADLKKSLADQAKTAINQQLGEGEQVVINPDVMIANSNVSAEIGTEGESLSATVEVKATGLAYATSDVKPIAQAILQSLVPEGYSIDQSDPQILTAVSASSSGQVVVDANLSINAVAQIDESALKTLVEGQRIPQAEALLISQPPIKTAKISLVPGVVSWFWPVVPSNVARIELQIQSTP